MGTRTYSRRGANGTRVLTRLGRERQQSGRAAPQSPIALVPRRDRNAESEALANAIRQRGTDGKGKRRNVQVISISPAGGNVVVTERSLTEPEWKKLDKLPLATRPARTSDAYEFQIRPTREVVAMFMAYEGMTFEEALARVKSDIQEYKQKKAEADQMRKTTSAATDRIQNVISTSEFVRRFQPVANLITRTSRALNNNPDLDVRTTLLQNLSMPDFQEFQNLSPAQLQRLVTATYLLTNDERENPPRVRAQTLDLRSENTWYSAHYDGLNALKPQSLLPTFYDFVVEQLGA